MSDEDDLKPLLVEVRDIVLRHEEVNRKDAEFRKRIFFVLLIALAVAVMAMGDAIMLVHKTTKEIRQRQEQQQPEKVASVSNHFVVDPPCQTRGAHGWRGNTTDKLPSRSVLHIQPSSVVLPCHPWA